MLSALGSPHVHTAWPLLSAAWCPGCSAMLDFYLVWSDHLLEKEPVL